jgi:hypothetical protein
VIGCRALYKSGLKQRVLYKYAGRNVQQCATDSGVSVVRRLAKQRGSMWDVPTNALVKAIIVILQMAVTVKV